MKKPILAVIIVADLALMGGAAYLLVDRFHKAKAASGESELIEEEDLSGGEKKEDQPLPPGAVRNPDGSFYYPSPFAKSPSAAPAYPPQGDGGPTYYPAPQPGQPLPYPAAARPGQAAAPFPAAAGPTGASPAARPPLARPPARPQAVAVRRNMLFTYKSTGAKKVEIAGDFTNWKPRQMRRKDGAWTFSTSLTPGIYSYQFIVDGAKKVKDPNNPRSTPDGKSILTVKGNP